MEYPHQQYLEQMRQQRVPPQSCPPPARPQAGTGDFGGPLGVTPPSPQETMMKNFQSLAQCTREEARFYLETHNYDLHQAMAARAADVEWERQHPGNASRRRSVDSARPLGDGDTIAAQLQEARDRMRQRYETRAAVSTPSAPAPMIQQQTPSSTVAHVPFVSQPTYPAPTGPSPVPQATLYPNYQTNAHPQVPGNQYAGLGVPGYQPTSLSTTTAYGTQAMPITSNAPGEWAEAQEEEARIHSGAAPRESYLKLAGHTLGRWIWGGSGTESSNETINSSNTTHTSTSISSTTSTASSSTRPELAPRAETSIPLGEERLTIGRQFLSDDSLEINELERNRRHRAGLTGTVQEDEEHEARPSEEEGGSRLHSLLRRGRDLVVDRLEHWALPKDEEEEALERRKSHRRRSLTKKEKRASLDDNWVLIDSTSRTQTPLESPLTDEQYAARLSRQIAEEEIRQQRRDEELARRLQREEEARVRQRALEAERQAHTSQELQAHRSHDGRRSRNRIRMTVRRGPFGEIIVSNDPSQSALLLERSRGNRRDGGFITLFQLLRDIHEVQNGPAPTDSNYPFSPSSSIRREDMSYEQLLRLSERIGNVNRGVSAAAMEALPTRIYKEKEKKDNEEEDKCTICLCEYEEGDELRALPCLHSYHKDCIDNWLKSHNTCPVCKMQINM